MEAEHYKILETMIVDNSKTVFSLDDFLLLFPDKTPKEVKEMMNQLVRENFIDFWSISGSVKYALKKILENRVTGRVTQ